MEQVRVEFDKAKAGCLPFGGEWQLQVALNQIMGNINQRAHALEL